MAIDKSELLLARLFAVLSGITFASPNTATYYRNRGELPKEKRRPAIVLLDGSEDANNIPIPTGRQLNGPVPLIVTLLPQVFVLPEPPRDVKNDGIAEDMRIMRGKVIKAVMTDAELRNLCGSNGRVEYRGLITDMQTGSTLKGEMQFNFALTYVLNINDL